MLSQRGFAPIIFILAAVVLIAVVAGAYYVSKQNASKPQTQNPVVISNPSSSASNVNPQDNSTNKIIFVKDLGLNADRSVNSEIWMMNTDGTNSSKLNIRETDLTPLNNISKGWVYYTSSQSKSNNNWTIYAHNFVTNQNKQIPEANQPNSVVNVSNFEVSPDSKKILYNISYTQLVNGSPNCGQEPCADADLYPDHKSGTYVYDIETDKKIYLGSLFRITGWDLNSTNVFTTQGVKYHEYNLDGGFYSINTDSGAATLVSKIPNRNFYYYYVYQITGSSDQIISENLRVNGAATQNSEIKIVKGGQQKTIDTGNICSGSRCFTISADEKNALYTKNDSNNLSTTVMLLDLATLATKPILQAQTGQKFISPTWVSNSQFVVEIVAGDYPDDKHNLSLVDITTGATKALTNSDKERLH